MYDLFGLGSSTTSMEGVPTQMRVTERSDAREFCLINVLEEERIPLSVFAAFLPFWLDSEMRSVTCGFLLFFALLLGSLTVTFGSGTRGERVA